MAKSKPQDISEYKQWLEKDHGVIVSQKTETHYKSVAHTVKQAFENSDVWQDVVANLREFNDQYVIRTAYPLLTSLESPEIVTKPFDSFLLKTYRRNVLDNARWPHPPSAGWLLPDNWYSEINDIVRTFFVVKYLDGVKIFAEAIRSKCSSTDKCKISYEARDEGYYAAHLYIRREFEVPKISWDTEEIEFSIEIQITTQLQEVIRTLLHKYYEDRRERPKKETHPKWQWNYESDEFVANYLGHILHYVEGMIMDIRKKQEETVQ